ncbi:FPR1, partial [Symbiodinium natans]
DGPVRGPAHGGALHGALDLHGQARGGKALLEMRAKAFGVLGLSLELKQFMRLMAGLLGAALLVEPVSHRRLWQGLKTVAGPSQSARLRIGLGGLGLSTLAEQ